MNRALCSLLLVTSLALPSLTSLAQGPDVSFDDIYGTHPPAFVKNWTRLSILGGRHHPFLVIWISSQRFPRVGGERLLTLPSDQYDGLVSTLNFSKCLKSDGPHPEEHRLLITEHSQAGERQCILTHSRSCKFLTSVSAISEIRTSKDHREILHIFASDADCIAPK
jgi:hypothetical protein